MRSSAVSSKQFCFAIRCFSRSRSFGYPSVMLYCSARSGSFWSSSAEISRMVSTGNASGAGLPAAKDHTGHTGEFQNFTDRRGLQCVNIFCKFVLHGYILPFRQRFDRIQYPSAAQDFQAALHKVCAVLSLEPFCRLSIPPRAALPLYYNTYFRFRQHKFFYPVQKIMRTGEKLCFESNRSGKALRCCWHLP